MLEPCPRCDSRVLFITDICPNCQSDRKTPVNSKAKAERKAEMDEIRQQASSGSDSPVNFVGFAAAAVFLFFNRHKLGHDGGFIYIIAAVVLGSLSAGLMVRKR